MIWEKQLFIGLIILGLADLTAINLLATDWSAKSRINASNHKKIADKLEISIVPHGSNMNNDIIKDNITNEKKNRKKY